jgi:hypothetical protein
MVEGGLKDTAGGHVHVHCDSYVMGESVERRRNRAHRQQGGGGCRCGCRHRHSTIVHLSSNIIDGWVGSALKLGTVRGVRFGIGQRKMEE